jgi:hypothetical protein
MMMPRSPVSIAIDRELQGWLITNKRFGDFEFVGGLELSSSSSFLGAMSAIRLAADRQPVSRRHGYRFLVCGTARA